MAEENALVAVIMAGGSGKRFWPLSVADTPKQFLKLTGEATMLQDTWRRLDGLIPPDRRLIVTAEEHVEQCLADLDNCPRENVIGEPQQRDTAAAALLGTMLAERRWPGAVVVTLPADHLIRPAERFRHLLHHAAVMVEREQVLSTIGVTPTYPSSGYGYIERGKALDIGGGLKAFRAKRFCEKPDAETAAEYIQRGTFYWNAGIFIWQATALLAEARAHLGAHVEALEPAVRAWGTDRWGEAFGAAYEQVERISIDYGIMERTDRTAVVEANFTWSDLGGWIALGELLEADAADNRRRGETVLIDSAGNVIFNTAGDRPIICVGLRDTVVAHTDYGVLVCPKEHIERVKHAVEKLYNRS